jgi:hypothetical protein
MPRSKSWCQRAIVVSVMLLLVCAQALALVHRVAHAPLQTAATSAVSATGIGVEQSCAEEIFGHERGLACLDFDASLGLDTTASVPITLLQFAEHAASEIYFESSPRAVLTRGLFLARAPPRA